MTSVLRTQSKAPNRQADVATFGQTLFMKAYHIYNFTTQCSRRHTLVEVHVLLEGVFGGQGLGAHSADEGLLSRVHALVDQQGVLLGEGLPTHGAPERLLSWNTKVRD